MNYSSEYKSKLRTPEEAVKLVKNGDWVEYSVGTVFAQSCDAALAKRRDELTDVKIRGMLLPGPVQVAECDPTHEHFTYSSWHCSGYERKLCDKGIAFYEPMLFRNLTWYYENFLEIDVMFVAVTPMDERGYFNFSVGGGVTSSSIHTARKVVVEINENLPWVHAGAAGIIHISEVAHIVEGTNPPLLSVPVKAPGEIDLKIAQHVIPYITSGATLQIGIGGVPDALAMEIANSDLVDFGMHTEFCTDALYTLHKAGKLTNRKKAVNPGLGIFGIAQGTQDMYDWLGNNVAIRQYPLSYVNDPYRLAQMDDFISINGCVSVDLYGQIVSESAGTRHISGTGGQVDFVTGASMSKGGKSFICVSSTFTDKEGNVKSKIVPHFHGDIVTTPRSQAYYIATEHGVVNLAGRTTWERAERLISIADPMFRDELIEAAKKQNIWRRSNKR